MSPKKSRVWRSPFKNIITHFKGFRDQITNFKQTSKFNKNLGLTNSARNKAVMSPGSVTSKVKQNWGKLLKKGPKAAFVDVRADVEKWLTARALDKPGLQPWFKKYIITYKMNTHFASRMKRILARKMAGAIIQPQDFPSLADNFEDIEINGGGVLAELQGLDLNKALARPFSGGLVAVGDNVQIEAEEWLMDPVSLGLAERLYDIEQTANMTQLEVNHKDDEGTDEPPADPGGGEGVN